MKKNMLFISCEEAKHICDKKQYNEATGWDRLKLGIRLSWCRMSRAYSSRNHKLTEIFEKSDMNCLKNDERAKLEQQFDQELAKHK
jgi:hypothetical protein